MITLDSGLNGYEEGLNARRRRPTGQTAPRRRFENTKPRANVANVPNVLKFMPAGRQPASVFTRPSSGTRPNERRVSRPSRGIRPNILVRSSPIATLIKNPIFNSKPRRKIENSIRPVRKPARKPITSVSNLTPATIVKVKVLQEVGVMPNVAQLETIAEAKGTTVKEEIEKIVVNNPEVLADAGLEPTKKDNTMLYVGGGIVALGLAYVAFK